MRVRDFAAVAALGVALLGVAGCGAVDRGSSQSADGAGNAARPEAAAGMDSAQKPGSRSGGQPVSARERHVVRTASLAIKVDDVTAAAAGARQLAEQFGGYVADERTGSDDAGLTLKVDATRLDAALTALDELGEVTHRAQQAEDVTEQVVDVQARIANQRASVERVRALLDRATTVGEVVQIESELTNRQAELESLEQRAAALAAQTELATVTVTLAGDESRVLDEQETGFLAGLRSGWDAFVTTVSVGLTVFGAMLPFLLALAIPVAGVLVWLRHRRAQKAETA